MTTPVLLLRPLAGSAAMWGTFRDELARERPVIVHEHRASTSTRRLARDPARVLDEHGPAHVFGLSLGGMVATWLAIDRPELVRGLVLASAPARGTAAMQAPLRGLGFVTALARPQHVREAGLAEQVLSPQFRREQPVRAAQIVDQFRGHGGSLRVVLQHVLAAARHDATRHLARVQAPTLCLAGALDDLVPPAAIADLARRLPRGRFDVIDGAGHDLSLEAPHALAQRVTTFFARCERS